MFISKRFIGLVLLGVLPAALSFIPGIGAYAFLGYNVLLFLFLAVDFSISPKPQDFFVKRMVTGKLSMSVWNKVELCLKNPVRSQIKVKVRDSIPDSFICESEVLDFELEAGEVKTTSYQVKPIKRGEYVFPDLHMRVTGILGLCVRSKTILVSDSIKVYPNLKDMRNHHLAIIQKKRLLTGFKKIRQMGIGTEFESIREYSLGDDFRHINWAVTARTNQLYVNQYEPERNQYVYIMMDTSRVMSEEIEGITRLDYAVNAAFIVAETVMNHGDYIGMMAFDSEIHKMVKPGKGTAHFQRLADNLYNIEVNKNSADYEKMFSTLQKTQNRRSLVLLFTDPFNMEHAHEIVNAWRNDAPRHKVMVLSIKNPFLNREAKKRTKASEDIFLKSAALKLLDDRRRTFAALEMSGIPTLESNPDAFTLDAVNQYIELKMK